MLIGALARSLHRYLFDPIEEKGTRLPLNRFEIFLSAVLAFALMVAISLMGGPSKYHRPPWIVVGVIFSILVFSAKRKTILGVALAIVTARAAIGLADPAHFLIFFAITGGCGITSWLLLREGFRQG
ncbi:MAG TPA: hypothetical protein VFF39_01455 [Verrucomicrobiae bacterium]|jgi:hypothetical protein|nr:hypothetical protein [Verrucomicrobiae bacterium]